MLKESLSKVLSEQVNAEYYSAYFYLAMSAYADRAGFKGIANWLFVQAQEEMAHGTHIYQYILERGSSVSFEQIQAPSQTFVSIADVFSNVLAHERKVTDSINNIASLAMKESDHALYQFILWFVNEQVEEESSADGILSKLNFMGNNNALLYNLDAQLGTRVFVNPFPQNNA